MVISLLGRNHEPKGTNVRRPPRNKCIYKCQGIMILMGTLRIWGGMSGRNIHQSSISKVGWSSKSCDLDQELHGSTSTTLSTSMLFISLNRAFMELGSLKGRPLKRTIKFDTQSVGWLLRMWIKSVKILSRLFSSFQMWQVDPHQMSKANHPCFLS